MSRRQVPPTARTADRHQLYEGSVQDAPHEVSMLRRAYRDAFGRDAMTLREDFCGTAAVCAHWVRRPGTRAWGVDLDKDVLAWGVKNHLAKLPAERRRRVTLWRRDVRSPQRPGVDIVAAQNFSFQVFKERNELRRYFRHAYGNLGARGVFLVDMMGGPTCQEDHRQERRRCTGFTYEWEQERFDPISHHALFHINFYFRDGTRMRPAFTYDWRLWTMPEVSEVLREVGFRDVVIYWLQGYSVNGQPIYKRRNSMPADQGWITYVVGIK